jgi:hypothetical protein
MAFESETEKIFLQIEHRSVTKDYTYIEYGPDFVIFKNDGGNMYQIAVTEVIEREQKPRKEKEKPQKQLVKKAMTIDEFRKLRKK